MDLTKHIVYVVDDDPLVREAVGELLNSVSLSWVGFGSVQEYLDFQRPDVPSCIVLDIELPGVSGLEFQAQLEPGDHPPVVFVTGHADVPSSVRAMKLGAIDFLIKPFDSGELIASIRTGLEQDEQRRNHRDDLAELNSRFSCLTAREKDVLPLVVSGLMNKQAAAELGISEVTFQIHRKNVMQKMKAASLADLVRISGKLGVTIAHTRYPGAVPK